MKLICVLGGTSWPSTVLPYRLINKAVQRRCGGHHSARFVLCSIDYQEIKSRYWDRWPEIPEFLLPEIEQLLSFRPDCWMLANNTMHKAYDAIADRLAPVPFFPRHHAYPRSSCRTRPRPRVAVGYAFHHGARLFAGPLRAADIDVVIPEPDERETIQAVQSRLSRGEIEPAFSDSLQGILRRYEDEGCAAVVTACTELPLVVNENLTNLVVVDPLVLQCAACVDFALD